MFKTFKFMKKCNSNPTEIIDINQNKKNQMGAKNIIIIKDRINENYDVVKNEVLVKKFLKGYELWLDDYIE